MAQDGRLLSDMLVNLPRRGARDNHSAAMELNRTLPSEEADAWPFGAWAAWNSGLTVEMGKA